MFVLGSLEIKVLKKKLQNNLLTQFKLIKKPYFIIGEKLK